jgi:hypothetical protein
MQTITPAEIEFLKEYDAVLTAIGNIYGYLASKGAWKEFELLTVMILRVARANLHASIEPISWQ